MSRNDKKDNRQNDAGQDIRRNDAELDPRQNDTGQNSPGKETRQKKQGWLRTFGTALNMELREHKSSAIVYLTLRALVIVMMILQLLNRNFENVFLCALTLVLLVMPSLIQVTFKVELPTTLEIIILFFIFAAEILGEISEFYLMFPFWDAVLHTLNGFLAAAIGFSMVDLLNRSEKTVFNLSPLFTAIVAFCFSMTIGVVWEFFEFFMDQVMGYDMQKDTIIHMIRSVTLDPAGHNVPYVISNITETAVNGQELGLGGYLDIGLIDTMQDLIVNFIGAAVFSVIGFFYVKNRGKGKIVGRFVPRRKAKDRDFLEIAIEAAQAEKKPGAPRPERKDEAAQGRAAEKEEQEDDSRRCIASAAEEEPSDDAPEEKEDESSENRGGDI